MEWLHVCVKVDSQLSLVKVSVNGGETSSLAMERRLNSQDLRKIHVQLGIPPPELREKYPYQFSGLITNINIYRDSSSQRDLRKMSSDPCQFAAAGDLLAWEDMEWEEQGEHLQHISLEPSEVCDHKNRFNIPLVLKLNWFDANKTCHILNNGTISEMRDSTKAKMSRECDFIWTPYVLDESKQEFRSSNTGKPLGNLPWFWNAPGNGQFLGVERDENLLLDFS